jgi:putative transposon-encoded protein
MAKSKLTVTELKAYFKKKVTKFGNGAKIDCPKEYIGKQATVIIEDES